MNWLCVHWLSVLCALVLPFLMYFIIRDVASELSEMFYKPDLSQYKVGYIIRIGMYCPYCGCEFSSCYDTSVNWMGLDFGTCSDCGKEYVLTLKSDRVTVDVSWDDDAVYASHEAVDDHR